MYYADDYKTAKPDEIPDTLKLTTITVNEENLPSGVVRDGTYVIYAYSQYGLASVVITF